MRTPSHGGYFVPPHHNRLIPAAWRKASWNGNAERGWYEEDCDWCLTALTFPTAVPAEAVKAAQATFDGWIAPKLARAAIAKAEG